MQLHKEAREGSD
ncbi:hypothetical protein LINPERPRIM_LOCUS11334 [Linum perenne]